jgi:hypothetical protein
MVHMTLSAEEHNQRMEELLAHENNRLKSVQRQLETMREVQFKKAQELHEVKQKEANSEGEIQVIIIAKLMY